MTYYILKLLLQVRGYKRFLPLFPHEVGDLQPVLDMLADQNPKDSEVRSCCTFRLTAMSPEEKADEQCEKKSLKL